MALRGDSAGDPVVLQPPTREAPGTSNPTGRPRPPSANHLANARPTVAAACFVKTASQTESDAFADLSLSGLGQGNACELTPKPGATAAA
eukprot:6188349-Pleurochrysis_carterae.AAC.1